MERLTRTIGVAAAVLVAFAVLATIVAPVLPMLITVLAVLWLLLRLVAGPHFRSSDDDRR